MQRGKWVDHPQPSWHPGQYDQLLHAPAAALKRGRWGGDGGALSSCWLCNRRSCEDISVLRITDSSQGDSSWKSQIGRLSEPVHCLFSKKFLSLPSLELLCFPNGNISVSRRLRNPMLTDYRGQGKRRKVTGFRFPRFYTISKGYRRGGGRGSLQVVPGASGTQLLWVIAHTGAALQSPVLLSEPLAVSAINSSFPG